MREHFIVDNSTTPDWEVIPLGPVDKEGRKVSLSTATLCLLWAMLMDSYSRWRTTWDVFNETGESYDL